MRFLALKTNRWKYSIVQQKSILNHDQKVKAKETLDKAMIDSKYYITKAEFDKLSLFEQKMYEIRGVYMYKEPNYFEKLTCVMYMEEC